MKTAWFIDDDEEMGRAVRLMLDMLGYSVRLFHNVRDAARILQYGERPNVLILDVNMPEISGWDMLEFIRRNSRWDDLPLIMLSSEFAEVQIDRALEMGADAYVVKPVMIDELEAALTAAFEKRAKKPVSGTKS